MAGPAECNDVRRAAGEVVPDATVDEKSMDENKAWPTTVFPVVQNTVGESDFRNNSTLANRVCCLSAHCHDSEARRACARCRGLAFGRADVSDTGSRCGSGFSASLQLFAQPGQRPRRASALTAGVADEHRVLCAGHAVSRRRRPRFCRATQGGAVRRTCCHECGRQCADRGLPQRNRVQRNRVMPSARCWRSSVATPRSRAIVCPSVGIARCRSGSGCSDWSASCCSRSS